MSVLLPIIVALLSIILPGYFLALALLKKTGLPMFEIAVIGFIFGLIFPPTVIWLESFLIPFSHAFTFSNGLYTINVIVLTLIGIALCVQQGVFGSSFKLGIPTMNIQRSVERDYKKRVQSLRNKISELGTDIRIIKEHEKEEEALVKAHIEELRIKGSAGEEEKRKIIEAHAEEERRLFEQHEAEEQRLLKGDEAEPETGKPSTNMNVVWIALLVIMLVTFATRMMSLAQAPHYFEFDPYYDMISTQFILTYGYQLLYSHSAWPTLVNGTIQRLQPLVPYFEAYWYNLAGATPSSTTINTTLLSNVGSVYPPIAAALLVFVVFMFVYHEYGDYWGLIAASLAAAMPVLITTFIAGEQLLEPWGIFALFFFYAAYLLAVNNPDEPRYAILAGIAFASNFLGAHYYTVTAGILALYIIMQGSVNILRSKDSTSFFKMNAVVIGVILLFFIPYNLYGATLNERTPGILGIPITVGFPIAALVGVFIADFIMKKFSSNKSLVNINSGSTARYAFLAILLAFLLAETYVAYAVIGYVEFIIPIVILEAVAYFVIAQHILKNMSSIKINPFMIGIEVMILLAILGEIVIAATPLGKSVFAYIQLSKKFTTASSPLFMTVQEYAPTGWNYNFGSGGFGLIGTSIGGISLILWIVMFVYSILVLLAIYNRDSKVSILSYSAVWSVAIAGLIEVKYLPHYGVAYIIAIATIFGELALYYSHGMNANAKKIIMVAGAMIVLIEAAPIAYQLLTAAANSNCNAIGNSGNALGAVLYCNTVPQYWLAATSWMKTNVGPYGPRILSWWDYGDWINWFGNSNAVLRGDNSVAQADYNAAQHYVFTPQEGFNNTVLEQYMNGIQAKYILFDDQLVPKWGALDFLGCAASNPTAAYQYAISQGVAEGAPYQLGTSACELQHDPAYIFLPLNQNVNNYCSFPNNSTAIALKGVVVVGASATNTTYCIPSEFLQNGTPSALLDNNGTKTNVYVTTAFFGGETNIGGQPYISFLLLYAPNAPNGTITDAPSDFYSSAYYRGFFLGNLGTGYTLAYPSNFTHGGLNYINGTHQIMIFQMDNYTGTLPYVVPKPKYVTNNYTMPG